MNDFNMPPGVSVNNIPGNEPVVQIEISFSNWSVDPKICMAEAKFRGKHYLGSGETWEKAKENLVESIINGQRVPPSNETIEIEVDRLNNASLADRGLSGE